MDNSDRWRQEAEEFLRTQGEGPAGSSSEAMAFATSLVAALYGPESAQMRHLREGRDVAAAAATNPINFNFQLRMHALGVIKSTVREMKAGLVTRLRVLVEGETLQPLVALAREILESTGDGAKNASAVLAAATYEALIRKMGEEFAAVTDRPKLEYVIGALKDAEVLKGGQVATAQSYLKFRNDSLHADWTNVDRSQVESCLPLVSPYL